MSPANIKPWVELVSLHPDVISEDFSEDIFALDLGPLADGQANVPAVYRDAEHFFEHHTSLRDYGYFWRTYFLDFQEEKVHGY